MTFVGPLIILVTVLTLLLLIRRILVPLKRDPTVSISDYCFPIVGHLPYFFYNRNRALELTLDMAKTLKSQYMYMPQLTDAYILSVSDPPSVQHVLKDNFKNYDIPKWRANILPEVFGHGIFSVNGKSWELQRELAVPTFKMATRKEMVDIYIEHSKQLIEILENASKNKEVIDIQQLFKRLTLDTIGEIGFGYKIGAMFGKVQFCEDFDWILDEIEERVFYGKVRFWTYFKIKSTLKRIDKFIYSIIEARRGTSLENKTDFLSNLLQTQKITGNNLSDKFIRDYLMNFFVAGRDTTATLITRTFVYLAKFPQVYEKVVKEVHSVLGDRKYPTFKECQNEFRYLRMVLDEVLRLHPPAVPSSPKEIVQDDILPNGVKVFAGQSVMISPYAIHRLEHLWGDRAEEFWPERWENPETLKHPYQFIPFQKGPRTCLGMQMAYEEASCFISIIVQNNFKMDLVAGQDLGSKRGLPVILTISNGVNMMVQKA